MLEVDKINSFYGKAHVLNDLSLRVEKAQVVSLLGRTGTGAQESGIVRRPISWGFRGL